jgi:hypothetical protein
MEVSPSLIGYIQYIVKAHLSQEFVAKTFIIFHASAVKFLNNSLLQEVVFAE